MAREIFGTVVRPLLTERSTIMKEKHNQYVFETALGANKVQIKRAIEDLFKVRVEKVRTMIVPGKFRRFGRGGGLRPDWKKAVVTLEKGQKIDFTEQAG
ncbi:MAG: 50S ribosomal protein L23 [Elusimicrobia bacterium RIFCSPHIGHO2_02_FULL_57_9]|nr:MAG: 50S ribosomal protein L23 [Elusimicrobia bacterium RIFCSPHIGHO2_02_FULL_57_9]